MKRPQITIYAIVLEERFLRPRPLAEMRRIVDGFRDKGEAEAEKDRLMAARVTGKEWKTYSVEEVPLR